MRSDANKPRIVAIGTGGSIAMIGRDELDLVDYPDTLQVLEIDELIERVPWVSEIAVVECLRFRAMGSSKLGFSDWLELYRLVMAVAHRPDPPDGIVITHGTATLEETAFFLHLTLKSSIPVVLTGAMRPPTGLSSDACINLLNAVRVASTPAAHGMGVLVVMNNTIHCARDVAKASNWQLDAFQTTLWGPLGMIWPDGRVDFQRLPMRKHTVTSDINIIDLDASQRAPIVEIVPSYAGADGKVIESLVREGVDAIVVAGLPPGLVSLGQKQALQRALDGGVVIIQASRAPSGRIILREISQKGLLSANDLTPQKARILGTLGIREKRDAEALQILFDTH